jgi:ubiquinone/menaquinone biosynthesis C-methylase UbiE
VVERFVERIVTWARRRPDVLAVGLVGSQARGAATPESDFDLVVVASSPARYVSDTSWASDLGVVKSTGVEEYGPLVSVRVGYADGPEVEFGFTSRVWAALPADAGTAEVVAGGMKVLFEREPLLSLLLRSGASDEPLAAERAKRELAGVFGRAAPLYDRVGPRFFSHFGRRLVERAQVPNGAQVLDVATGRGAVLFPAADAVGPGGHVTGIDLSAAMVRETAAEIDLRGCKNADVRRMDAEHLQFPEESFDCVLCGFALFFLPRLDRALGEVRRVLRPEGRFAATTWESSFEEEWSWFDELVEAHLPVEARVRETVDPKSSPLPGLDKSGELLEVMKAAGFVEVRVVLESAEFVYSGAEEWWSALWSHGAREDLEVVAKATGPGGLDELKATVCERLRTIKRSDGIHQRFPALFTVATKPQGSA